MRRNRSSTSQAPASVVERYPRANDGMPRGAVSVPFCYYEAAANVLTNPVLDPFGEIPEFKYCAVGDDGGRHRARAFSFGGGSRLETGAPAAAAATHQ